MNKIRRSEYMRLFPATKNFLYKVLSDEKTDKGQAYLLINTVAKLGSDCLTKIKSEMVKKENKELESAMQYLHNKMNERLDKYCESIQEYMRCAELSSSDHSCKKYEQRMRSEAEDTAVKFYIYVIHIKSIIKDKAYIKFYDENRGIGDSKTIPIPKELFDINKDSIMNVTIEPHHWDVVLESNYTEIGVKRYITQQTKKGLSEEDKEWIARKYYVAHIDLSAAPLHTVYLAKYKAEQFKKYWGIDEVEEYYYKFDIPQIETTSIEDVPDKVYFHTCAGIDDEIVIFYFEKKEDSFCIISPTLLSLRFSNLCEIVDQIGQYYIQGHIDKSGKITATKDPYGYIPTLSNYSVLNEVISFRDIPYENTRPYQYTLAELIDDYKEELEDLKEEKRNARSREQAIRYISYGYGIPRYELDALYRQYEEHLLLEKQGKSNGIPKNMTFRRYFLWANRGYPLYERSHSAPTFEDQKTDIVQDPDYEQRQELLRKKYNYNPC